MKRRKAKKAKGKSDAGAGEIFQDFDGGNKTGVLINREAVCFVEGKTAELIKNIYSRCRRPPLFPTDYRSLVFDLTNLVRDLRLSCGGSGNYARMVEEIIGRLMLSEIQRHVDELKRILNERGDAEPAEWIRPWIGLERK